MIDLIYLDSSENDDDNDEAVTIQRMTVKMLTVKNVLASPFSMLYILILCFKWHAFLEFLYALPPLLH